MANKQIISKAFALIPQDFWKLLKSALIVSVGVFCTFVIENVGNIDFGENSKYIAGIIMLIFNAILKWVNTTKYLS